jgi:hypothetical protein
MIQSDPLYFSATINQDIEVKRGDVNTTYPILTSFRVTIPYGQKLTIKALKIYPTWLLRFASNFSVFPRTDIHRWIQAKVKFDVEVYRSCRTFSTKHMAHTNISTSSFDALNDIQDEIGSLSFPCKGPDSLLYRKSDAYFQIQSRRSLWWSYVYDISLFLSSTTDIEDGFEIDTSNASEMLRHCISHVSNNTSDSQITLHEPHAFWFVIHIKGPYSLYMEDIASPGWSDNATLYNTSALNINNLLSASVRVPIWELDPVLLSNYQASNTTLDFIYQNQAQIDFNKTRIMYNNISFTPFFMSSFYNDLKCQGIALVDTNNFLTRNWTQYQVLSKYNRQIYENNPFTTCYSNDTNASNLATRDGDTMFTLISSSLLRPYMAYRLYGINGFDPSLDVAYPWSLALTELMPSPSAPSDTTTTSSTTSASSTTATTTAMTTSTTLSTPTTLKTTTTTFFSTGFFPAPKPPTPPTGEPDNVLTYFNDQPNTTIIDKGEISILQKTVDFWQTLSFTLSIGVISSIIVIILLVILLARACFSYGPPSSSHKGKQKNEDDINMEDLIPGEDITMDADKKAKPTLHSTSSLYRIRKYFGSCRPCKLCLSIDTIDYELENMDKDTVIVHKKNFDDDSDTASSSEVVDPVYLGVDTSSDDTHPGHRVKTTIVTKKNVYDGETRVVGHDKSPQIAKRKGKRKVDGDIHLDASEATNHPEVAYLIQQEPINHLTTTITQ